MCNTNFDKSVAVVIPYYNGSETIERAVRSVLDQKTPAAEFVVIDDGSRPEEARFVDGLAASHGFKVLRKENGGQGSARNAGVHATKSPFICFLDQDDYFLHDHICKLSSAIPTDDPRFGWVYGDLSEAEKDGSIVRTRIVSSHARHPKQDIFDLLRADMFVLPSASLISRSAFEAVGGFDTQFMGYEDDDLFLRMFRKGYTNYFVDAPVTVWCIHSGSTSFDIKMSRSRVRYFRKLAEEFPDDPVKNRYYFRDLIAPRFYVQIIGEAVSARAGLTQVDPAKTAEYVDMANQYASEVTKRTVRKGLRIKVFKHKVLLSSSMGKPVYRVAVPAFKRARNFIRFLAHTALHFGAASKA